MTVLIVTSSDDNESVTLVSEAVGRRGETVFRFDTDRFPTRTRLIMEHGPDGDEVAIVASDREIEIEDVSSIWFRRLAIGRDIPRDLEPQILKTSVAQSRTALIDTLASLDAFTLDPLHRIRFAENKALQLKVARRCGLATLRTLVSNDPEAVRAFAASSQGRLVTRMRSSFSLESDEDEQVIYSNPVTRQDLEDLSGLALCPMMYQELVEGSLELRVAAVGERTFTALLQSGSTELGKFDWRRDGLELIEEWKPYDLPDEVADPVLDIMDHFQLNYGIIDIVVEPDGRYVFADLNPVGEYLWLETRAGLPVSDAIAEVLLGLAPRREGKG